MSPSFEESPSHQKSKYEAPLLKRYVEKISAAAEIITSYCALEGLPQPSFDPQAPAITLPSTLPDVVLKARHELIDSAARIQQLVTEPAEYLPTLQISVRQPLPRKES